MDYEHFITIVERAAGLRWKDAERATRATLMALADMLPDAQAHAIGCQLPGELADWVGTERDVPSRANELIGDVAEREGVDRETARQHAGAVLLALRRSISPESFDAIGSALPDDLRARLAAPPERPTQPMDAAEFWRRVGDDGGLSTDEARRATRAVLQTLALRLSGDEVDHLAGVLPPELRDVLEDAKAASRRRTRRMGLGEFVERVADREGVPSEDAREHASAVLSTLAQVLSEQDLADLSAELPRDIVAQLVHR